MTTPNIIFIVPYRNRENDKIHFDVYMKYLLEDLNTQDYEIYFSHQNDKRAFNRGAVKNIGFIAMRNKYPDTYKNITFVFNDIDILPIRKNMLNYNTTSGIIKHFYGFDYALGGIFSITGEDFEKIKGFPNYWGWGWEDNVINNRCVENNINIDRTNFYKIFDNRFVQTNYQDKKVLSNKRPNIRESANDNIDTIKNLDYIINDNFININNFNTIIPYENKFYIEDLKNINSGIAYDKQSNIEIIKKKNHFRMNLGAMR